MIKLERSEYAKAIATYIAAKARTASARDAYDVAILAEEAAYKAVGEARINFRR